MRLPPLTTTARRLARRLRRPGQAQAQLPQAARGSGAAAAAGRGAPVALPACTVAGVERTTLPCTTPASCWDRRSRTGKVGMLGVGGVGWGVGGGALRPGPAACTRVPVYQPCLLQRPSPTRPPPTRLPDPDADLDYHELEEREAAQAEAETSPGDSGRSSGPGSRRHGEGGRSTQQQRAMQPAAWPPPQRQEKFACVWARGGARTRRLEPELGGTQPPAPRWPA